MPAPAEGEPLRPGDVVFTERMRLGVPDLYHPLLLDDALGLMDRMKKRGWWVFGWDHGPNVRHFLRDPVLDRAMANCDYLAFYLQKIDCAWGMVKAVVRPAGEMPNPEVVYVGVPHWWMALDYNSGTEVARQGVHDLEKRLALLAEIVLTTTRPPPNPDYHFAREALEYGADPW
jgi:hypothetical protein